MLPEVHESSSTPIGTDDLSDVLRDYMTVTRRLQQTHEALQHEVVRLRGEVASKERELQRRRRLASLGELAAGVAHEVRNPLGAIQLYSGLLRSKLGEQDAARALIDKIDAGIHAIDCVVQDTLALSPRPGKLERCSLRSVLDGAHDTCQATLKARGVGLEQRLEGGAAEVLADATALQRVFVNLIANAAQASPLNGSVVVSVGKPRRGRVAVRVSDEGPGLPEAIIERVFDPFFTTKEHGTGLGLAIAHRLAEAHGGRLTARNRPEGGAEFEVLLPVAGSECEEGMTVVGAGRPSAA